MKGLITCFEDFSSIKENTSRIVAEKLNLPFKVLPVSFSDCDNWINEDYDFIIQLGVAASRSIVTIERFAHNLAHSPKQADNQGVLPNNSRVDLEAPLCLETTIPFDDINKIKGNWEWSYSAGTYVCNSLYFKSLWKYKKTKVIFIHLPYHLNQKDPSKAIDEYCDIVSDAWFQISKNKITGQN